MKNKITKPTVRIKLTGICNRSCNFCNEEGDMKSINTIKADDVFFERINNLLEIMKIDRVMLTGGEPTLHKDLGKIIKGINSKDISITTNGFILKSEEEWKMLKDYGLSKVIISMHNASPQSLISSETKQRNFGWAIKSLNNQTKNIYNVSEAKLNTRINIVAYDSVDTVKQTMSYLKDLYDKYFFDIRILNDLSNVTKSQEIIDDLCASLEAEIIKTERRSGSSNVTTYWKNNSGFYFSTKTAYKYFLEDICNQCTIKQNCDEGFYGIRIEKRSFDYYVRLCIYKNSPEILMPLTQFMKSPLLEKLRNLYEKEIQNTV